MKISEIILQNENIAYALFDKSFKLIENNEHFSKFCNIKITSVSLFDVLPEAIGLEETLQEMISHKKLGSFDLPYIQREKKENTIYYNCTFRITNHFPGYFILTIKNVTNEATLNQQIIQKKNENHLLKSLLQQYASFTTEGLIGNSESIKEIHALINKISLYSNITVLLLGESGTGKNLVARLLHEKSDAQKPFIEINCAAIPENLLEAELFGYKKGAFTSAVENRKGLIEEAHDGTLFLDEIGELPLSLQAKLLAFLETKKFRSLGSNVEKKVSVRLIAATNRNLEEMIIQGKFREDLFYRLNVIKIELPALRKLNSDILLIAEHLMHVYNKQFAKGVTKLSEGACQKLLQHSWPGNVRELSNVIERAMIFAEKDVLEASEIFIPQSKADSLAKDLFNIPESGLSLHEIEFKLIKAAIEKSNGNKTKAAALLGLSRDTFRYRLEKHKIDI